MVTEPDFGSDVAGVKVTATPTDGGYLLNGVKTWCTFAGRADTLMVLARTDPDRSLGHRGLSVFVVDKPPAPGHHFAFDDGRGGKMEGRAIDTLGYRGMHSYEVAFDSWFVPAENLVGLDGGLGKGFYLQMEGFENGRLQTAARAVGVMQAAFEAGLAYAAGAHRVRQADLRLPALEGEARPHGRADLRRPPVLLRRRPQDGARRRRARGQHGEGVRLPRGRVGDARSRCSSTAGMGYAEEFPVSRYFVDARVLSIFEGADETLCLRVIARRLTEQALARARRSPRLYARQREPCRRARPRRARFDGHRARWRART